MPSLLGEPVGLARERYGAFRIPGRSHEGETIDAESLRQQNGPVGFQMRTDGDLSLNTPQSTHDGDDAAVEVTRREVIIGNAAAHVRSSLLARMSGPASTTVCPSPSPSSTNTTKLGNRAGRFRSRCSQARQQGRLANKICCPWTRATTTTLL
jgi:hypothetical protein